MIPVRNIYYMLSYAFRVLQEQGYKSIETEEFHNVGELCAAILSKGISAQIKRGLGREYISLSEELASIRGRIDIAESVKTQSMQRKKLVCTYDEFSINSYMNRIIKSTMCLLLRSRISSTRKMELRKLLVFFDEVDILDVNTINWKVQYNRNNQTYRMLIAICFLVIKGLLQTQSDGTTRLMDFLDEQRMHRLYEKFILEYYRYHHPELNANPDRIDWDTDSETLDLLPKMQTDITLKTLNKILIIDAKYYSSNLQSQFDVNTVHSSNLYQIYTYVSNMKAQESVEVSGMLLYAKTDAQIQPNNTFILSGNRISVTTLDLNVPFDDIRKMLEMIVEDYFD